MRRIRARAHLLAAVDVIVTAAVACVFYLVEGRRVGLRMAWVLVPLTFGVALAFTFPLFLAIRERRLHLADPVAFGQYEAARP